jgi:hypothetical protein
MLVARELNLHAMTKVGHASSRLVVSQGLGVWDSGIRFVVAVVAWAGTASSGTSFHDAAHEICSDGLTLLFGKGADSRASKTTSVLRKMNIFKKS